MPENTGPLRLGVSACLLGRNVRWDGGHRLESSLRELESLVEWVPVCPETEAGFGVPRESMELAGDPAAPRLRVISSGEDKTGRMREWMEVRLEGLAGAGLCGFVLKGRSPSCGLEVMVAGPGGTRGTGRGLFAGALKERFPRLPLADEEGMRDAERRGDFLRRVLGAKGTR
jgi:uncharacterized protein YbbK (DUF523 family)